MWALAKALLRVGRSIKRLAIAVEDIRDLYKLELDTRFDIRQYNPALKDKTEVSYAIGRTLADDDSL